MWEIDLANQLESFFLSIPLGFMLGALFYILEGVGHTSNGQKIRQFISDIFFFIFAGFVTYCFLLIRSKGEIRGYILVGELIGFLVYKKLFGKITVTLLTWLVSLIKTAVRSVFRAVSRIVCLMCAFIVKIFKKVNIFSKKGLKKQDVLVYTETNNTEECE